MYFLYIFFIFDYQMVLQDIHPVTCTTASEALTSPTQKWTKAFEHEILCELRYTVMFTRYRMREYVHWISFPNVAKCLSPVPYPDI